MRVQIERLRQRLKPYYEDEGAAQAVRFAIPEDAYKPAFVIVE